MKKLGNAEIAMAMELKSQGVTYEFTAYYLGVSADTMKKALWRARREGMVFGTSGEPYEHSKIDLKPTTWSD